MPAKSNSTAQNEKFDFFSKKPRLLLVVGGSLFMGIIMFAAFVFGSMYGQSQTLINEATKNLVPGNHKAKVGKSMGEYPKEALDDMPGAPESPVSINYKGWLSYSGDVISYKYPSSMNLIENQSDSSVPVGTEQDFMDKKSEDQVMSVNTWYNEKDAVTLSALRTKYKYKDLEVKTYNGTKWNLLKAKADDANSSYDHYAYYTKVGKITYIIYLIDANGWNPSNKDVDKFFNSIEFVF